ncbi:hypothetical protein H9P43_003402 [Blastocladiella emersonii ATCC 22665]|nr:hypothetical protein H9P43_003402 [Blastocladiella emersonii ATCC 22665]
MQRPTATTFQLRAEPAPWADGDRISLPAHALEALQAAAGASFRSSADPDHDQGHLYTFTLTAAGAPDRRVACGVRDFAHPDPTAVLVPPPLLAVLAPAPQTGPVLVDLTLTTFPKATGVQLRPMATASEPALAYLGIPDLRAVLEAHLRRHFTCLTAGTTLSVHAFVPGSMAMATVQFLVAELHPAWAATVVNTDVSVDVVPPTDDTAALEAMHAAHRAAEKARAPRSLALGAELGPLTVPPHAPVCITLENVVSHLPSLPPPEGTRVLVHCKVESGDANLFLHPWLRPTVHDNWGMAVSVGDKTLVVDVTDALEDAAWPSLFLAVEAAPILEPDGSHAAEQPPCVVRVRWELEAGNGARPMDVDNHVVDGDGDEHAGETKCETCSKWVPTGSLPLHQLHCQRNTVRCATCSTALSRPAAAHHVHCPAPDCGYTASAPGEAGKHAHWHHPPSAFTCPDCPDSATYPDLLGDYQTHRRSACPHRVAWCRFCRTHAAAGEGLVSAADRLNSGCRTPHAAACAARTVDCATCGRPVKRRDVPAHMAVHRHQRENRPPPLVVCANAVCGRPAARGPGARPSNALGLCAVCYGPLHSSRAPEGGVSEAAALLQRVVHRYFRQATNGCGEAGCTNPACASVTPADRFRPALKAARGDPTGTAVECMALARALVSGGTAWFCVPHADRVVARREVADELAGAHGWTSAWCLEALLVTEGAALADDGSDSDEEDVPSGVTPAARVEWATRAVEWLLKNAPTPATKN